MKTKTLQSPSRAVVRNGRIARLDNPTLALSAAELRDFFLATLRSSGEVIAQGTGATPHNVVSPTTADTGDGIPYAYPAVLFSVQSTSAGAPSKATFTLTYDTELGDNLTDTFDIYASSEVQTEVYWVPGRLIKGVWHPSGLRISQNKLHTTTPDVSIPLAKALSVAFTGASVAVTTDVVHLSNNLVPGLLSAFSD